MKKLLFILFTLVSFVSLAQQQWEYSGSAAGTDTYTLTLTNFNGYQQVGRNVNFSVCFTNSNTGPATLNVSGPSGAFGAESIVLPDGTPLSAGDIQGGYCYRLHYNGADLVLGQTGSGGGGSGTVQSVTGDGVDNTDPDNPVLTFPVASEVVNTPAGGIAATDVQAALNELDTDKQAALVSGTNIKTVGGTSLLGSGNVTEVTQTITNGVTTTSPSEDAVFDALALKAPLASPTFTGTPAAPTASPGTNTTQLASTAFVQQELLTLANARTITTSVAIAQSDNLKTIFFNSASPINFTLDALTTNTEVTLINIGTGTVTFLNGTGVTFSGSSTLTAGNSGFIKYTSSATPLVLAGADVPTATSSTSGIAKLYTSTGSNTDGAMDQNSATNAFILRTGTTSGVTGAVLTQTAASSGTPKMITFTPGAHTGLTASTEVIDIDFDLNRTVQRAAGTVTSQRSVVFRAPTYSFVSSSTINDAATVAITGAPVAGTNATISNRQSLWVQGGISTFGSTVQSGYTGSLVATVNTSNRIALLGAFEFVNSGSPSYSGIGVSLPGSGRTLSYYGGTLGNASDFSSSVWSSTSLGTARAGTNLSNVSITMPSTNSSVFTATDYSLLTLDGTPPTLTTPLSVWYGMKVLPGSAGNATKNVAIYTNSNAGNIELGSNLVLYNVGSGISIKEGTNATMGLATLVAGTVTVNTTKVTANSRIMLTRQNLGTITVPVGLAVSARSSGTSFTILSGDLSDTSTIAWQIIEPAP